MIGEARNTASVSVLGSLEGQHWVRLCTFCPAAPPGLTLLTQADSALGALTRNVNPTRAPHGVGVSLTTVNAGFSASGLESRNALCIRGSAGELQGHCHAGLFLGPTASWPRRGGCGDFSDAVTAHARPVACWEWGTTGAVTGGHAALPARVHGKPGGEGPEHAGSPTWERSLQAPEFTDLGRAVKCCLTSQGQIRLRTQARANSARPPAMHCSPRPLP